MFHPLDGLPEKPRRLSRSDYERMIAAGILVDEKVELLHGVVIEMSPQTSRHAYVISKLIAILAVRLAGRALVHAQAPLALTDDSEPEPDFYVTPIADFSKAHPRTTLLLIEVALTSIDKDKDVKAALYAAAEQPEYWLVDIENRCLVVHRTPKNGRYSDIRSFAEGERVAMLQFPDVDVAVSEMLPSL